MGGDSSLHRGVLMLALEEQEGRRLLDVVPLARGYVSCGRVGRAREVIHVGGQAFIGRDREPVMSAGSQRCSYQGFEILDSQRNQGY